MATIFAFGDYGLNNHRGNNDITSRQISPARRAMTRYIKRGGKIWIRIFSHTPRTRKPQDVKMGDQKVIRVLRRKVKAGTVLFEMKGVHKDVT